MTSVFLLHGGYIFISMLLYLLIACFVNSFFGFEFLYLYLSLFVFQPRFNQAQKHPSSSPMYLTEYTSSNKNADVQKHSIRMIDYISRSGFQGENFPPNSIFYPSLVKALTFLHVHSRLDPKALCANTNHIPIVKNYLGLFFLLSEVDDIVC